MMDFITWCFGHKAPDWVNLLAMAMVMLLITVYLVAAVVAAALGFWSVAIVMTVIIPVYALARAYARR